MKINLTIPPHMIWWRPQFEKVIPLSWNNTLIVGEAKLRYDRNSGTVTAKLTIKQSVTEVLMKQCNLFFPENIVNRYEYFALAAIRHLICEPDYVQLEDEKIDRKKTYRIDKVCLKFKHNDKCRKAGKLIYGRQ